MAEAACLDHVGLVGRDIAAMIAAYRRLGFAPTPPQPLMGRDPATGADVSLQQTSAHLVLDAGYVELSAVHTDSPRHHLAPWLARGNGLHILAFGVEDIRAAHERCAASGLAPRALSQASRRIAYGEHHGEARFEWFMLEPDRSPEGLICFVRQVTPELVFQPAVQRHPNGALALEGTYIGCADPAGLARRLAAMTGGSWHALPGGARVEIARGWLECLDAGALARRFPGAAAVADPSMAGLSVRTRDLAATARCLAAAGLQAHAGEARLWLDARDCAGCLIEFTGDTAAS
jgi:hypothetical protein